MATKQQRNAVINAAVEQAASGDNFTEKAMAQDFNKEDVWYGTAGKPSNAATLGFTADEITAAQIKQYEYEDSVRQGVFADIRAERHRQDELCEDPEHRKYGWRKFNEPDSLPLYKLAVLGEEVGEVSTAVLRSSDLDLDADLESELVQVAAVAVAWIEAIRQNNDKEYPDG